MRIEREAILNSAGITSPAGPTPPPKVIPAETPSGDNFMGQAKAFVDDAYSMIVKVDEMLGLFMGPKSLQLGPGGGELPPENTQTEPPSGNQTGGSAAPVAGIAQFIKLLEVVAAGEGDIPLSKLTEGIKNQEPWLIKYAEQVVGG